MEKNLETRCVHGGEHRFPDGRDALSMPIYQTAAFAHPDLGHSPDRFYYTRLTNPTRNHLEETVSALEGAADTVAFATGMAAIAAVEDLVGEETIRKVAKTFGGVEHRIELVRVKDGVSYYNDSIASSPSSMALRTVSSLMSNPPDASVSSA